MTSQRIALIGFGLAGRVFHAPLIAATEGLELSHVVTSSAQRAAEVAGTYPAAAVVPDPEMLWSRAVEFDAVVVASPNVSHVPLAVQALEHGLPVVVDKPLATSSADGQALFELAQGKGVLLTVFQNRRWDGDYLTLRRLIDLGELGTPHRFESRFERWRPEVDATRWRESADPALAGGLLFDLGSHLVDQALQLQGPAVQVYAEVAVRRHGAAVDDDVFIATTHRNGAVSHLWASALAAHLGPRLRVLGDRAAYVVDGLDPQEGQLRDGMTPHDAGFGEYPEQSWGRIFAGDQASTVPTAAGEYLAFYEGLRHAFVNAGPPPVDARDAIAGLRVLEAARRSAQTATVVALEDRD